MIPAVRAWVLKCRYVVREWWVWHGDDLLSLVQGDTWRRRRRRRSPVSPGDTTSDSLLAAWARKHERLLADSLAEFEDVRTAVALGAQRDADLIAQLHRHVAAMDQTIQRLSRAVAVEKRVVGSLVGKLAPTRSARLLTDLYHDAESIEERRTA